MSTTTTNMGMTKPATSDPADIAVLNTNTDLLDIHDHSINAKGLAVARLAATTALAGGGTTFSTGALTVTNLVTASAGLTVTTGVLTMGAAASQVVPGATSFSIRNTASSSDNLIITDAGAATIRAGLTVTAGGLAVTAGNLGIGSAPQAQYGANIGGASTSGTSQWGVIISEAFSSSATVAAYGIDIQASTAAAAFTVPNYYGIRIENISKGAASAVTNNYGLLIDAMTSGATLNYGIFVSTPSGGATSNMGIRISGGTPALLIDAGGLTVSTGNMDFGTGVISTGTGTRAATGQIRMASQQTVAFRNNANSADNSLTFDSTDKLTVVTPAGNVVAHAGAIASDLLVTINGSSYRIALYT